MQLALYKAPGTCSDKLIRVATFSKYSHCELVIDDVCYSSSPRDNGVRARVIDLSSGSWDLIRVSGDPDFALKWFKEHEGLPYDLWGAVKTVIPFSLNSEDKWFCSEACAAMLQLHKPRIWTPAALGRHFTER